MIVVIISGIVVLTGGLLLVRANRRVPLNYSGYDELFVTSPSFVDGIIPEQFTGNGEDRSPQLVFANLSEEAVSIAVIMDDLDVPVVGVYNHWTIWNIPPQNLIPEGIPHGVTVGELGGAVQGVGYGLHRYRGPKPPFGNHRYQFHVFVLDTMLDLKAASRKKSCWLPWMGIFCNMGRLPGRIQAEKKNSTKAA